MAKRILIRDLKPAQLVEGVYAIHNCQLGQTKTGKPYIKCLVGDRSDQTPGRMWNASEELFRKLPTDGFVWLEGQTQPYQGQMQIIIQQISPVDPSPDDLLELLPRTEQDIDQMFAEVCAKLETLEYPALKALAKCYLQDEQLIDRFRQAPAAMTLHHAYLGGLLEHTRDVMRLAEVFCPLYPKLNRDLIVIGLFLHDLGKCQELAWSQGFSYSDDGHLVGHVAQGMLGLQRKAEDCAALGQPVPSAVLRVLHHIILSHHGKAEFGALKIPATPEAIAVSLLDNLDAKVHMALAATRSGDPAKAAELGGNFTEKVWALETRLYRPDPTTVADD
ncbi:MAG: HD domain-containing protein [Phycisphaeraceae bacterium]